MLKENQTIFAIWNSRNKKYYVDKGYTYTKMGNMFEVDIKDLTPGSKAQVTVICDYCGKEVIKKYQTYLKQHHDILGDCCKDCEQIKIQNTWLNKYGCTNVFQSDYAKNKSKETCLNKYGTEYACQSEEVKTIIKESILSKYGSLDRLYNNIIANKTMQTKLNKYGSLSMWDIPEAKEKYQNTALEHFGVKHPSQSDEIKAKKVETCQFHFGVNNPSQAEEVKEKSRNTCIRNFGVPYSLQSLEIRAKGMKTLSNNGTVPTSKQQLVIYNMLLNMYDNCKLNYPESKCSLDCMLKVNDAQIDVEYDGSYWHRDEQKDRKRDEFLKKRGYKILRIKGSHKTPTKEQLKEAIDYLVKGNHSYTEIILDI